MSKKFKENLSWEDDDEYDPASTHMDRIKCPYCGNKIWVNPGEDYVCRYCGYDSEL